MQKTIFVSPPQGQPNLHSPPEREKLQELIDKPQTPLLTISTAFPFDLFPSTLTVDAIKVHLITRQFFATEQIHSFPVKSIADIVAETGPIFATLKIFLQMVTRENQLTVIKNLWRHDACRARDLIQGLIIAARENIEITKLPSQESTEELQEDLEKLGKTRSNFY